MILSGHYHGGIMRLPFLGSVISLIFVCFPAMLTGNTERKTIRLQKGREEDKE